MNPNDVTPNMPPFDRRDVRRGFGHDHHDRSMHRRFAHNKAARVVMFLVCGTLAFLAFGLVTEHLWNWLMPSIFGLVSITFWQAIGLLFLGKLLFGGFHGRGGPRRSRWKQARARQWKRDLHDRMHTMSPEEREQMLRGIRERGYRAVYEEPRETPQASTT